MSISNISKVLYGFTDMNTLNERGPLYKSVANEIIDTDNFVAEEIIQEILERIKKYENNKC